MKKNVLSGLILLAMVFSAVPAFAAESAPVNAVCPVSGDKVNPEKTFEYQGKTYAFCCENCMGKFKKNPEKYIAA